MGPPTFTGALDFVVDDNRISQLQREMLERPENYLRPIRLLECWTRPADANESPNQVVMPSPTIMGPSPLGEAVGVYRKLRGGEITGRAVLTPDGT